MKRIRTISLVLAALAALFLATSAGAEESISGTVQKIDLAAKTVVVKSFFGEDITITISDEDTRTLDKLRQGVIKVDDAVRVRYVAKDGRNVATFFRKSAGC